MNIKYWILLSLAILAFTSGAIGQHLTPGEYYSPADVPSMILGGIIIFLWYYYDTEEIKYQRNILLNMGVIFLAIIALPYYFFRSRGFKNGAIYTVAMIFSVVIWSLLQYAGEYAMYYGIQS